MEQKKLPYFPVVFANRKIAQNVLTIYTLPDNFSDTSGETDTKRLAKPFYCKTILQIVFYIKNEYVIIFYPIV